MNQLTAFLAEPHGRRLLVHGPNADIVVRDAARAAGVKLMEFNAKTTPIDDIVREVETLATADKQGVIFLSSIDALGGTRADWRIRGNTQFARRLGLVMAARFKKTLLWLTAPGAGFYKQLSIHGTKRPVSAGERLRRGTKRGVAVSG